MQIPNPLVQISGMTSPYHTLRHIITCPHVSIFHYIFISPQLNSTTQRKCILFYFWFPVLDDSCQFHDFAYTHAAPSTV